MYNVNENGYQYQKGGKRCPAVCTGGEIDLEVAVIG